MKSRYLLLIILMGLILVLSGCKDQSLLTNLDQRQATEVQAVLQKHQISSSRSSLGKGLFDVSVNQEDMARAIQILEEYQLPTVARIEVTQIFPTDALVSSPQAEKARLISAIEQRLEQSLLTIDHIIDARVHVSYPLSPTERVVRPPHASAIIFYEDSTLDSDQLGDDVRAFIHNAFSDLDTDNITVLLYPRNITKFNIVRASVHKENNSLLPFSFNFNSTIVVIIGGVFVGIILFISVIFIVLSRHKKKKIKEDKEDKDESES